jgi:organic radical activating enzyme
VLKHILTNKCTRKCSYCITRNVHEEQETDLSRVEVLYRSISNLHPDIMLTGGEPLLADHFCDIADLAGKNFNRVFLTTQNEMALYYSVCFKMFRAITFSIHDNPERYKVLNGATVYAAVMADKYFYELPYMLKDAGFAGLTINEDQRSQDRFNECLLMAEPEIKDFSIRINRRGRCMNDTIMIMPDLSIINDFSNYL